MRSVLLPLGTAVIGFLLGGLVLGSRPREVGPSHAALQQELRAIAERQDRLEELLRQARLAPALRAVAPDVETAPEAGSAAPVVAPGESSPFVARMRERARERLPAEMAELRLTAGSMDARVNERAERWQRRYALSDAQIEQVSAIAAAYGKRRAELLLEQLRQIEADPAADTSTSTTGLRELEASTQKELEGITGGDIALVLVSDFNQMVRGGGRGPGGGFGGGAGPQ